MRYISFLNENNELEEIVKILHDNCSQYRKESNNFQYLLYRGVSSSKYHSKKYDIKETKRDRKPSDTPLNIHNTFNEMLKKKFGWYGRSEHVLFCFGIYEYAESYGKVFNVFPFDGYKYIWSPKVKDFFQDLNELISFNTGKFVAFKDKMEQYYNKNEEQMKIILNNYIKEYQSTNLKRAIQMNNEIMLYTKKALIVDYFTMQKIIRNKMI